jgi:molecular chaperone HtpG
LDLELTQGRTPQPKETHEELVYAAAVLILSEDLYPRKLEIVREYIQNASDALDQYRGVADVIEDRAEPVIKISIQGRSLLIFDNGIGMDGEEIAKLKRIAYSEKKLGEEAGYKGIGRLAGIAVADKLKISSTSYGDPKLYHFEFRAKDMRQEISDNKKKGIQHPATQVINRHSQIWETDIDPESHYTLVELRDIKESCSQLLDSSNLQEYIGDIGPVDFSPEFKFGAEISHKLNENVPDYSPKTVYLSVPSGERVRIYKPYTDQMTLAEPGFIEIHDQAHEKLMAYCWYATKGMQMLGKIKPAGKLFTVDGTTQEAKRRFAGLCYKLFGFSIGDRSLPQRTLWTTALPRALWYTGEIHIVDKNIIPTTDRSHFVENEQRDQLFASAQKLIVKKLNDTAQIISDNRRAYTDGSRARQKFDQYKTRLEDGTIDRAELKTIKQDIHEELERVRKRDSQCRDGDISKELTQIAKLGKDVKAKLDDTKNLRKQNTVADVASDLDMPSKARKVFQIIMETLESHFVADKDEYYRVARKISDALKKKY